MKMYFVLIMAFISLNCDSSVNKVEQSKAFSVDDIYGEWIVKRYVPCPVSAFSDDDAMKFINKNISLENSYAVVFSDSCYSPKYDSYKNNTQEFLNKEIRLKKEELGIVDDSIFISDIRCNKPAKYNNEDSPEFDYFIFKDSKNLFIQYQGIIFILEKVEKFKSKIDNNIPQFGDTVKCRYHEKSGACTRFVIQGTRNSGKVIHVNPVNKNVPLEVK